MLCSVVAQLGDLSFSLIKREFGIKESGGSDFHGERRPETSLGAGQGNLRVPKAFLEALRAETKSKNNADFFAQ